MSPDRRDKPVKRVWLARSVLPDTRAALGLQELPEQRDLPAGLEAPAALALMDSWASPDCRARRECGA